MAEGTGLQQHGGMRQCEHSPLDVFTRCLTSLSFSPSRARAFCTGSRLFLPAPRQSAKNKKWNSRRGKIQAREGTLKTHSYPLQKKNIGKNKCHSHREKKRGKSRKRKKDRDGERKKRKEGRKTTFKKRQQLILAAGAASDPLTLVGIVIIRVAILSPPRSRRINRVLL